MLMPCNRRPGPTERMVSWDLQQRLTCKQDCLKKLVLPPPSPLVLPPPSPLNKLVLRPPNRPPRSHVFTRTSRKRKDRRRYTSRQLFMLLRETTLLSLSKVHIDTHVHIHIRINVHYAYGKTHACHYHRCFGRDGAVFANR